MYLPPFFPKAYVEDALCAPWKQVVGNIEFTYDFAIPMIYHYSARVGKKTPIPTGVTARPSTE